MKNTPINICGISIQGGERLTLALPTPEIYTCAPLHIPMHVIHGKKAGPKLLVCATLYGDETNGIDIVHRLLETNLLKSLAGTLICIPVMNVYGLINQSHFLPDGHDLAANFPGSKEGTFAERLAFLLRTEVMDLMTHCINIRSGPRRVYKIPQVYYHPEDEKANQLARSFNAPLMIPSQEKTGFFYSDLGTPKCPTLIYEGGEANRSDDYAVKIGVKGIIRVLKELDMIRLKTKPKEHPLIQGDKKEWIHSPGSGIFHFRKMVGKKVDKGELLAVVVDPFGSGKKHEMVAPCQGVISAAVTYPYTFEGDQLIEITTLSETPDE